MKFKKTMVIFSLLATSTILLFTTACSGPVYTEIGDTFLSGQIYSSDFFADEPILLDMTDIKNQDSLLTLPNMNSFLNKRLVIGKFDEQRKFYNTLTTDSYHYGMDLLVTQGTEVVSPYNAELLYATYVHDATGPTANEGIGGVIVMKVKVTDMTNLSEFQKNELLSILNDENIALAYPKAKSQNIKVDYVYLEFMHLSRNRLANGQVLTDINPDSKLKVEIVDGIDFNNPQKIKQGEKIGLVGIPEENGGWAPHVHVQMINPAIEANTTTTSIVRLNSQDTKNLAVRRIVGVGPKKYISGGIILDPNKWLTIVKDSLKTYIVRDKE